MQEHELGSSPWVAEVDSVRLLKPKLISAVQHWRRDWEMSLLNAKLRAVTAQLETACVEGLSEAAMKEEMQRLLDEQMAQEREKRIEHATQMAIRRVGNCYLTRGWVAWYDGYVETAKMLRMLKSAGARLARPRLITAVQHWRMDWGVARHNAQLQEIAVQLKAAREQGLSDAALNEEMKRQLHEQLEQRKAKEREERIEHLPTA